MKLYSTYNRNVSVSFKEAVMKGISDDGGLFLPARFIKKDERFFQDAAKMTFNELAYEVSKDFLNDEINENDLKNIINSSFTFDAPLKTLANNFEILELFHGPTLAFKDFGARFMANMMSYLNRSSKKEITILVATSGDTGSAVANGFYKVEGIKVVLLYPSNKVSKIQEQQLTTLGENITALEIDGTFDDCQNLVKKAFLDKTVSGRMQLSSANSINIGRLFPQSFYYFRAYGQLNDKTKPLIISVPSGNFGNLTAGLFAKEMGLPVAKFIAATNSNNVFPDYLLTGKFKSKPSVKTISNAMDVGNPSNFYRILSLYNNNLNTIKENIYSNSFSDEKTIEAIKEVHAKYNYIMDPHGAVGYLALKDYVNRTGIKEFNGIVLETAHPAKFADIVNRIIDKEMELPAKLSECMNMEKHSVKISKDYDEFKNYLLEN